MTYSSATGESQFLDLGQCETGFANLGRLGEGRAYRAHLCQSRIGAGGSPNEHI